MHYVNLYIFFFLVLDAGNMNTLKKFLLFSILEQKYLLYILVPVLKIKSGYILLSQKII